MTRTRTLDTISTARRSCARLPKDSLDALLDSIEVPEGFTGLIDPDTGNPLNVSTRRAGADQSGAEGLLPDEGYDPIPTWLSTSPIPSKKCVRFLAPPFPPTNLRSARRCVLS